MQSYLDGYEGYDIVEVNGVQTVTVSYQGETYRVYEEQDGAWMRSYADMVRFVHADGTFDLEAGNVFSFGVEESVDDQGRKVITINKEDYRRYKEAVAKIFEGLDPAGLVFLDVNHGSGADRSLTGENDVLLNLYRTGLPQIIGWASYGDIRIATLATDKGPISVSFVAGEILDFGARDTIGDAVSEMSKVASNNRDTDGRVILFVLMTSEGVMESEYYAIKNQNSYELIRALARGLKMSLEDFEGITRPSSEWVPSQQFMVAEKLIELEQPLPVHELEVKLLN